MRIFAGQPEAHQEHGRAEDAFEITDHGDAPSFPGDDRLATERRFERAFAGFDDGTLQIGAPRAPAVQMFDRDGHTCRRHPLHMCADQIADRFGRLIGHEAEAHLRHRDGREHGLRTFAGVAAEQAVHFARGARPQPLERGIPRFTSQRRHTDFVHQRVVAERQRAHLRTHRLGERLHIVVEARNRDAAVGVVHGGQNAGQRHRRIHDRATVHAGMQITAGAAHGDFEIRHAA